MELDCFAGSTYATFPVLAFALHKLALAGSLMLVNVERPPQGHAFEESYAIRAAAVNA
jgi:hypothetical protein